MKMASGIRILGCKRGTARFETKSLTGLKHKRGEDAELVNAEAKGEWSQRKGRLKSQDTGDMPGELETLCVSENGVSYSELSKSADNFFF